MSDHASQTIVTAPVISRPKMPAAAVLRARLMSHWLVRTLLKLAVSAGLIWLVCRNIDLSGVGQRFVGQSPGWLVAAAAATLVQIPLAALRWQRILRALDIDIPGRAVFAVTYIGSFFNSWLLGSGSGDVARALLAPPDPRGRGAIVHSVLFDRAATFAGIGLTILPVIALNIGPLARGVPVLVSLAVVSLPFIGLIWLEPVAALVVRWQLPFAWIAAGLVDSWKRLRRSWRRYAMAIALAMVSEIALTTAAYCLARAQHLDVSFADFLMLMPPVLLLGALPISVGGWGVRENVLVLALAPIGVAGGAALLVGIQIGLLGALVSLPGGAIWLFKHLLHRR
jgi:hypothetical protein